MKLKKRTNKNNDKKKFNLYNSQTRQKIHFNGMPLKRK